MHRRTIQTLLALAGPVALGLPCAAQPHVIDQTGDDSQPLPLPEPRPVAPRPAPQTERPPIPGLTEGLDWLDAVAADNVDLPRPRLLPEGAFLSAREGRLVEGPADSLIFIPDQAARSPGEGPMLLLPCRTTGRLRSASESRREELRVALTGEVYLYRNRNYLLPTTFSLRRDGSADPAAADAPAAAENTPAPAGQAAAADPREAAPRPVQELDPEVADLIRELEQIQDTPAAIDPAASLGSGPIDADTSSVPVRLTPEGTPIVRRLGRMVREDNGAWSFVFDNDADTPPRAAPDTRLILLPCQALQTMEARALRGGDSARFIVSGRITSDRHRNYLLPTLLQSVRDGGIDSLR